MSLDYFLPLRALAFSEEFLCASAKPKEACF